MEISAELIKKIRDETGVAVMEVKNALAEASGDPEKAKAILRKKSVAAALKKAEREIKNGIIEAYVHDSKIGVLVEIGCETDFVARNEDFKNFAHEIALQIAATNPLYISKDSIPPEVLEKQKDLFEDEALKEGKPKKIVSKIVEGKMKNYFAESCLLCQPWVKDETKTVQDLLNEIIQKLGENIKISRFVRYRLGE
jgi:elongation factor Ts